MSSLKMIGDPIPAAESERSDATPAEPVHTPTSAASSAPSASMVTQGSADPQAAVDKTYWRSLNELADTPEFRQFVQREFPAYADEMMRPTSRRNFLKIMGASVALAGMTACRWPREEILPFTRRPEDFIPGNAMHFATAMDLAGVAVGLLATCYDGRPVKLEGNPDHPASLGGTNYYHQAAVLSLYDPDRSQAPRNQAEERGTDWAAFQAWLDAEVAPQRGGGRGMRVLAEASSSPSRRAMRQRMQQAFPQMRWHEYESISRDNERAGTAALFGTPLRPHLKFDQAEVVVSLDDDFLHDHPNALAYNRHFFAHRKPEGHGFFNRLFVIESAHTVTGGMADYRIPVASHKIPTVAGCLAAWLFLEGGLELPAAASGLRGKLEAFRGDPLYAKLKPEVAGKELMSHRGHGIVTVGAGQPAETIALVHLINVALGNVGQTLIYTEDPDPQRPHHLDDLGELVQAMQGGQVDTLLILGGNPVYDAPADFGFADALAKVGKSVHLGLYRDETGQACTWQLPRTHFLEAWGDARSWDGTLSVVQPTLEPLYNGRSDLELLAMFTGRPRDAYAIVQEVWNDGAGDFEQSWRAALHDGMVADSGWAPVQPAVQAGGWVDAVAPAEAHATELIFRPTTLYDGRYANNGWLMELPDPITKMTWENAALMSVSTADGMGVRTKDVVSISAHGAEMELPVYVVPGMAEGSVMVALGFGRSAGGAVADGNGVDVYPARTSQGMGHTPAEVTPTGKRVDKFGDTQDHFVIDRAFPEVAPFGADNLGQDERERRVHDLIREADLATYQHDPEHAMHHGHHIPNYELWPSPIEYDGYKWGMVIDLNNCTGCASCVIACQAENNIPVVGKDEVWRGREMHWLRVDRYFSGDKDNPRVVHQPLPCQQCENAPCEQVCPVAATIHDQEGLNVMVYNRCIGTRYCSNNCPFKVRRFNYFEHHRNREDAVEVMVYNPEVTVRSRGVMEKCTYCLQRITAAKIPAKNDGRRVADGEVTPACAQVCPTQAITFGDMNDADSRIHALQSDHRLYTLLDVLNVQPRTKYLGRIRNSIDGGAGHGGGHGAGDGHGGGHDSGGDHGADDAHGKA